MRHLSLAIGAGEVVALVGENGAGKTTIVKLLARLYAPTEGRILLDGRDLAEYDIESLRAGRVIFQDSWVRLHRRRQHRGRADRGGGRTARASRPPPGGRSPMR